MYKNAYDIDCLRKLRGVGTSLEKCHQGHDLPMLTLPPAKDFDVSDVNSLLTNTRPPQPRAYASYVLLPPMAESVRWHHHRNNKAQRRVQLGTRPTRNKASLLKS
jgi:hypothetical protein